MRFVPYTISLVWFVITLKNLQLPDTRYFFPGVSLWLLIPFLVLNPFFEEILVRGYLTTELADLCGSMPIFFGT
jgi:membrane protease YdiL (CAAX protease family)